jgi:hypothetical protein
MRGPASLIDQTSQALAVSYTGAFVVMALLGVRSLADRSLLSGVVAIGGTLAWSAQLGVKFDGLRVAVVAATWEAAKVMVPGLPPAVLPRSEVEGLSGQALAAAPARMSLQTYLMADNYPGFLLLGALVGGWLAWQWYHRIAIRPLGLPPKPVSWLRFNDHLVWALILAFGVMLFEVPEPVQLVGSNLLFVLGALYWARGLAITRYAMAMFPAPPLFKVAVTALLVLPLAFGGWLLMGVADTWLDIRGRMQPPQGVSP